MTNPAQIARGLSKAQRKALASMASLGQIRRGTGRKEKNTTFFTATTFNSLVDKGLAWANHEKVYGLTTLGLAVRAELEKMEAVPHGWYCTGCPYHVALPDDHARCDLLDYQTEFSRDMLWDKVKVCGINENALDTPEKSA